MGDSWSSATAGVVGDVLVVLPAALPVAFGFWRWDSRYAPRDSRWLATATGALLGALVAVCVHGLLHALDLGGGAVGAALAWGLGYTVVWVTAGAAYVVARRLRAARRGRPHPGRPHAAQPGAARFPPQSGRYHP